jgi:hypothetical protein
MVRAPASGRTRAGAVPSAYLSKLLLPPELLSRLTARTSGTPQSRAFTDSHQSFTDTYTFSL